MAIGKSRKATEAATLAQLAGGGGKGAAPAVRVSGASGSPRPARARVGRPPLTAQERARRDHEREARVPVLARVPRELKRRLDVFRATEGRRLEDVVREALEDYLQRRAKA